MLKATIIGNYGATNLGDEAILHTILSSHPQISFTVFSHDPAETSRQHNISATYPLPFGFRSIFRGGFLKSFRTLKKSDFVIIGGGGLFTDEKIKAILLWGWHFLWAKFFGKPVFFYANSIGPLNSKIGKFLTKKILQKADKITLRDQLSADLINSLGIQNFKITADPAFLFETKEKTKTKSKKIAISLRNWIKHEKNYIQTLKSVVTNLENQGYQILLIPMQTFQDNYTEVLTQIASEQSLIVNPKDFEELIEILNDCEFTIGMRLHFLIASSLSGTPFITLSYSQKTTALAEELGQKKYLLKIQEVFLEKIISLINQLKKENTEIIDRLKSEVEKKKKKAELNKKILENFIKT